MRAHRQTIKNFGRNYSIREINKKLNARTPKLNKENHPSNIKESTQKQSEHSKGLWKIIQNPELIGIFGQIEFMNVEPKFYNGKNERKSADLYMETKDTKYMLEFKCRDNLDKRDHISK